MAWTADVDFVIGEPGSSTKLNQLVANAEWTKGLHDRQVVWHGQLAWLTNNPTGIVNDTAEVSVTFNSVTKSTGSTALDGMTSFLTDWDISGLTGDSNNYSSLATWWMDINYAGGTRIFDSAAHFMLPNETSKKRYDYMTCIVFTDIGEDGSDGSGPFEVIDNSVTCSLMFVVHNNTWTSAWSPDV